MINPKYIVLLVDRKRSKILMIQDRSIIKHVELENDPAPRNVKKGENTWDAPDKIFRHREDLLSMHLEHVAIELNKFARNQKIAGLIIGGHRPLFKKVEKHLHYPFTNMVLGTFVTELKIPQMVILLRAVKAIESIENEAEKSQLKKALDPNHYS